MKDLFTQVPTFDKLVDTLVIDYSVICRLAIFAVSNDDYNENETALGRTPSDDPMMEVFYQVAKRLATLRASIAAPEVILALDKKPYWREEVFDAYYRENTTWYYNYTTPDIVYASWDGYFHEVKYDEVKQTWKNKNMAKKLVKDAGFDPENGTYPVDTTFKFVGGELSDQEHARVAAMYGMESVAREITAWANNGKDPQNDLLSTCSGNYKGKRPWKFTSIISKEEFSSQMTNFAFTIAPLLGISEPIIHDRAEADDIIHSVCKLRGTAGRSVALVTIDHDLHQLVSHYENIYLINPQQGIYMVETNRAAEWHNFLKKIIGGDSSDNLKGVRRAKLRKDGSYSNLTNPTGPDMAEKLVTEFRDTWEEDKVKNFDPVTLARNELLVDLRNAPADLQAELEEVVTTEFPRPICEAIQIDTEDGGKRELVCADVNVGQIDVSLIAGDAETARIVMERSFSKAVNEVPDVEVQEPQQGTAPVAAESSPTNVPDLPTTPPAIPGAEKPKFVFAVCVSAHPTNPQFNAWLAGKFVAEDPGQAISMATEACPQFGEYYTFDEKEGKSWWWEMEVYTVDQGRVEDYTGNDITGGVA